MEYRESPEIAAAINELMLQYGNELWLFNAAPTRDDAGTRLLVSVDEFTYIDDVLPRRLGQVFLVVQRVDTKLVWEDTEVLWPPRPAAQA